MKQSHQGAGDNIGGNKTVNIFQSNKFLILIFAGIIVLITIILSLDTSPRIVEVAGLIETYEGVPAENCIVQISDNNSYNKIVSSNSYGRFYLEVPKKTEQIDLKVTYKNQVVHQKSFPLSYFINNNFYLKLPPLTPPYRVTYLDFDQGMELSIFLDGKLEFLSKSIKNPIIIKNNVYQYIKNLSEQFGEVPYGKIVNAEQDQYGWVEAPAEVQSALVKHPGLFEVGLKANTYEESPVKSLSTDFNFILNRPWGIKNISKGVIKSLESNKYPNNILIDSDVGLVTAFPVDVESNEIYREQLWTYASPDDFAVDNKYLKFSTFLANSNLPKEFGIIELTNIYVTEEIGRCPAGEGPGLFLDLEIPNLILRVIQIENTSEEAISLSEFHVINNDNKELRYQYQDAAQINQNSVEDESWLSRMLLPGESIFYPLAILFKHSVFDDHEKVLGALKSSPGYQNLKNSLGSEKILFYENRFPLFLGLVDWKLNIPEPRKQEFVLGPSKKLEALTIDGAQYKVRMFDPDKTFLAYNAIDAGYSCPFVFTYNSDRKEWENQGVILKNQNSKIKEEVDTKRLNSFNGSILIKELDKEITFFDHLYIVGKDSNEMEIKIFPKNALLKYGDGDYFTTKYPNEYVIEFEQGWNSLTDLTLIAKGYYEALNPN